MKLSNVFLALSAVGFVQTTALAQTRVDTPDIFSAERGKHHQLVETRTGNSVERYAIVGNGLNITNASGQWMPAAPVIQDLGDFVICTGAIYRVVFSANLNTHGAVDLETSDRQRIVSHPIGIGYYDPESGASVLLAQLKNSRAELVSSNLIVYRDAFEGSGITASVTYAYRRGRFSQDVTFERAPSVSPADLGLSSKTRLEVLTEFVETPDPVRTTVVMKRETDESKRGRMVEPDLIDEKLRLGSMTMMLGRAFASDASKRDGIPVAKRLLNIERRLILAEAVEWVDVRERLEALPKQATVVPKSNRRIATKRELPVRTASLKRESFEVRLARATSSGKPRMAVLDSAARIPQGFVLDYETVESASEFTFQFWQTYLIEDHVVIDGTMTVEAGAVIKFSAGASLTVAGYVFGPSGTAVMTSKDDNSAGAQISGSSGNPFSGAYAEIALAGYYIQYAYLGNLEIRFAETGLYFYTGSWAVFDSAFMNCDLGVYATSASVSLGPADMCNVDVWYDHDYYSSISPNNITVCTTDRDADGLGDGWELQYFSNLSQTANGDYDGDGLTNLWEFKSGTNPTVSENGTTSVAGLQIFSPVLQ